MACGRISFLQLGHGWSCTCTSARCERRRPFLDLDSLTFGRAMAAEFYRRSLLGRRFAALVRLGLARLQRLDTTPKDLVLRSRLLGPFVGAGHDPRRLGVRLADDSLLLRYGPVRLLDLVGKIEAELVDELHDLVFVDHHLRRQRNVSGVLDQVLEPVKNLVDLYLNFSFSALSTPGGTRSDTFPP